jgi:hypothetical protein
VLTHATLAGAVVRVQIDVGFGDAITPGVMEVEWRELLGFPEARLLAYPPETVIAEKLEAATELGLANSRMKDFFDLDWLCCHREFDLAVLRAAVRNTFARRGTPMPNGQAHSMVCIFEEERPPSGVARSGGRAFGRISRAGSEQ